MKVQYPGVADAIASDLKNTEILGMFMRQSFSSLDPSEMVAEIKERLTEELDYTRERDNQQRFVDFYRGHPFISVPEVVHPLCTKRVLTTELALGATFEEACEADEATRRRYCETLWRFVFKGNLVGGMFNADPHPGNYIFRPDGAVTFIDFGCVQPIEGDRLGFARDLHRAARVGGRHLALPLAEYPALDSFAKTNDAFIRVGSELGAAAVSDALSRAGVAPTAPPPVEPLGPERLAREAQGLATLVSCW